MSTSSWNKDLVHTTVLFYLLYNIYLKKYQDRSSCIWQTHASAYPYTSSCRLSHATLPPYYYETETLYQFSCSLFKAYVFILDILTY